MRDRLPLVMSVAVLLFGGCNRPTPVEQVMFEVDQPFTGEMLVHHDPKSANPIRMPNGSLKVGIVAHGRNTYDFSRWPSRFQAKCVSLDGALIEMGSRNPAASHGLAVVGWDGKKSMILKMTDR